MSAAYMIYMRNPPCEAVILLGAATQLHKTLAATRVVLLVKGLARIVSGGDSSSRGQSVVYACSLNAIPLPWPLFFI